jgi:hypothetical protein
MKRATWILISVLTAYSAAVAYGSYDRKSACSSDASFSVFLAKNEEKKDGEYVARRVWPRPSEWVPFQSTFVVSRNTEDYARITLRMLPWSRFGSCHLTRLKAKG